MIPLIILFFIFVLCIALCTGFLFHRSNFLHWITSRKKTHIYITLKNGVSYKLRITTQKSSTNDLYFHIQLLRRYGFFPVRFWFNGFGYFFRGVKLASHAHSYPNFQKRFGERFSDAIVNYAKAWGDQALENKGKLEVKEPESEIDVFVKKHTQRFY